MKGVSIRQPWAHAILHLGKDIENRSRLMERFTERVTVAVHASATMTIREWGQAIDFVADNVGLETMRQMPNPDDFTRGAIVGVVDIVGAVEDGQQHSSAWFVGPCGYILANPRPLAAPIPFKGMLGFWTVPEGVEKAIYAQLNG
jgi:hypothetical protein